jgi:hypothetical protein
MRLSKSGWVALSLFATGSACSYDPHPKDGFQACYSDRRLCPQGYACASDNRCYSAQSVTTSPGNGGAGSGGVVGTGGRVGTGGAATTGGTGGMGSGGATITSKDAGLSGTGGAPSTGGSTGAGGSVAADAASSTVALMTVANNQAQGAMTGFGWIAGGPKDLVTDPTCGSPVGPITSGVPCDFTNWSTSDAYCVSGSIPALPLSPTTADYNDNWGIQIGVNVTEPPGGGLEQSFMSLTIAVTGTPSSGLRAQVHRRGDPDETSYCAVLTAGTPIAFTSFNTACWDGSGTRLATSDVPNIDKISVTVPSAVGSEISVANLCFHGITFLR